MKNWAFFVVTTCSLNENRFKQNIKPTVADLYSQTLVLRIKTVHRHQNHDPAEIDQTQKLVVEPERHFQYAMLASW